jgi:hypothetical protein
MPVTFDTILTRPRCASIGWCASAAYCYTRPRCVDGCIMAVWVYILSRPRCAVVRIYVCVHMYVHRVWITLDGPVDNCERTVIKLWISWFSTQSICAMPVCPTHKRNFLHCMSAVPQQIMLRNLESAASYCTLLHKIARYIHCDIYCVYSEALYTDSSSTVSSVTTAIYTI